MSKSTRQWWKDILSPGTVTTADGPVEITPRDVELAHENYKAMKATGIADIPVLAEHVSLTDPIGNPRPRREVAVDELNATKGWIIGARMKKNGTLQGLFRIHDDEINAKIASGEIRYVSPTIRGRLEDRDGNPYRRAIAHVALTAKPRYRNQDEFEPAEESHTMALSELGEADSITLEEVESIQMADGDQVRNDAKDAVPTNNDEKGTEGNPDLPNAAGDQHLEALLAILAETCGLDLPADTDETNFVERLLTAAKTLRAVEAKAEAAKAKEDAADAGGADEQPIEDKAGVQMSEAQATQFESMKKRLAATHSKTTKSRLEGLRASGRIAPALFDKLAGLVDSIQLSDEGDEIPSITLSDLCDLLEDTTPEGSLLKGQHFDETGEEEHPEGESYRHNNPDEVSDEEMEEYVKRMGGTSRESNWNQGLQAANANAGA